MEMDTDRSRARGPRALPDVRVALLWVCLGIVVLACWSVGCRWQPLSAATPLASEVRVGHPQHGARAMP